MIGTAEPCHRCGGTRVGTLIDETGDLLVFCVGCSVVVGVFDHDGGPRGEANGVRCNSAAGELEVRQ